MRSTPLSRHSTRAAGLLALVALAAIAVPGAAPAQVHVDPGGPAGKQYSDTLDKARVDNGNGDPAAAVPGSDAEAPLFGEGVTRVDPVAADGSGKAGGKPSAQAESDGTASSGPSGGDGGGSASGLLIAVIGGVALTGAAAGFGIRRLARPPTA
jgi:hypothetical protein